jgi:hypothetical protein
VYYDLLETFKTKISETGIVAMIDVTTKADGCEYMPKILNNGVTKFTSANNDFSTILPISCCKYEKEC